MKKWWIGVAVFALVLFALLALCFQQPPVRVVNHDPSFVVYDVRYYPQTNRIIYWREAWRDALRFVRLKGFQPPRGPALVVYHSVPIGAPGPWEPIWVFADSDKNNGRLCDISAEYFGNKCVTKLVCPLTNGHYHLSLGETNWANIEVHLPN